jgi:dolichol-phosphate mannosyltransferase
MPERTPALKMKRLPIKKFIRFCLVGGTGAVIQFLITWLLTDKAGLYYLLSVAIAIGVAVIWTFTANYKWTFKEKGKE